MILNKICPPALIYLVFSLTQIIIDTIKGLYNTAFLKIWVTGIFTILLNFLCERGLGIISWFIVFVPFILMTLIVSILLLMFGLDPSTGKIKILDDDNGYYDDDNGYYDDDNGYYDNGYDDYDTNTSSTGPGEPLDPVDCSIEGGKCGGDDGKCCKKNNLKCKDGKCVVCLSLGSPCGKGDLCCHKKGKCGDDGTCQKDVKTVANNRAGGSGDTPDVPNANGDNNNGKGTNNLKSSQPYSLSVEGRMPTTEMVAAQAAIRAAEARGGYREVEGKLYLQ